MLLIIVFKNEFFLHTVSPNQLILIFKNVLFLCSGCFKNRAFLKMSFSVTVQLISVFKNHIFLFCNKSSFLKIVFFCYGIQNKNLSFLKMLFFCYSWFWFWANRRQPSCTIKKEGTFLLPQFITLSVNQYYIFLSFP